MSKPEFHLLIDDTRTFTVDMICRTPEEGKDALRLKPVTHLYLDHDLGEYVENDEFIKYENGYQILEWAIDNNFLPDHVMLVTSNPSGRIKMEKTLQSVGYERSGHWWKRT